MKNKKILILGSGALKIGEAGEFDYSGSQAIKALKEEGIKTVLINPNIATIQTSDFLADEVYFLPIDSYFVEKVIRKEKPFGILLSFGGQTALNCGLDLYRKGILKKYNVKVIGTPIEAISMTEDREKFAKHLKKLGFSIPPSGSAGNLAEALEVVKKIGFPVMVRSGFALGGQSSGVAGNQKEFEKLVSGSLSFAPQVLIEKYLHHYKEIEYEVVRDKFDNSLTICNMENLDPLGIHTGESIVVAPSQTLNDFEYHSLRKISLEVIRSLGIIGECNIQFALNPNSETDTLEYYIIEVNARLSRSSALASKATGYPLAYVAAKLAIGKGLFELENKVTRATKSFFEPSLDYIVVKMPRWDLDKFEGADQTIGSSMKSVGEAMAIGRTFEESLQKVIRMLDVGQGVTDNKDFTEEEIIKYLETPTPKRIFAISSAFEKNIPLEKIHSLTGIDPFFLSGIKDIVEAEKQLKNKKNITYNSLLELKRLGFSDKKIADILEQTEEYIRDKRKKLKIKPSVLQIDTLAGESPAKTNYLYMTYNASFSDVVPLGKEGIVVLGGGPYRIGSSVEFDWTCVNTALCLKSYGKKSIIVNCNPETVSTDYDVSDRLYFEELSLERVLDVYDFEKSGGVIMSVGGQTPNNLAKPLSKNKVKMLGTSASDIDRAENRNKFSGLLDKLAVEQPAWNTFVNISTAMTFADRVGYPVLVRPSYVLSGSAMSVCYSHEELKKHIKKASVVSKEYKVTISKFIENSSEVEFDAVAQKGKILCFAISKHIENAGVHSGDATIIYPAQNLTNQKKEKILRIAKKLSTALKITGPFNIQFIVNTVNIYVIEINLRASRTFPFISKATNINFAKMLTDALLGKGKEVKVPESKYVVVKSSQFSFSRLKGADPVLRVEMSSTGEVGCFGSTIYDAFLKSELSVGGRIPKKGIFLSIGGERNKFKFLTILESLKTVNAPIFATKKTFLFLKRNGIKAKNIFKIHQEKHPNPIDYFKKDKIDLAINIVDPYYKGDVEDDVAIRYSALENNIYLITDVDKAIFFIEAISKIGEADLEIRSWKDYNNL